MVGTGIMAGYVHSHPHPHTQLKKSGIPHTHTHTQLMRGFSVNPGTDSDNTHGDGFICHLRILIMTQTIIGQFYSIHTCYSCWSSYSYNNILCTFYYLKL